MKKFIKKCPLIFAILVSVVGITIYGIVGVALGKYNLKVSMTETIFSAVFTKDYKETEQMAEADEKLSEGTEAPVEDGEKAETQEPAKEEEREENNKDEAGQTEQPGENHAELPEKTEHPTEFVARDPAKPRSPYYDDPGKMALTTQWQYETVDNDYFKDAIFIGDSRIEGLCLYSGIDTAEFCYKQGLTVYDLMSEKLLHKDNSQSTLAQTLSKKQYGKIFMMIGINELGKKTTKDYAEQYESNVEEIQKMQPDAKIILMGIMNVTTEYSEKNEVFNNDNINSKNVAIAELADGEQIFYMDMNPAVTDKTGGLNKDYTWDGIHLKAQYYKLWADFLKEHGIV